jgi:hypothetical protein
MAYQTDAFYHLSVLFIISIMVFPLKRSSLVALVLAIPALTEIVQFFMPSRVPDFSLLPRANVERDSAGGKEDCELRISDFGFFKREKQETLERLDEKKHGA